MSKEKDTRVEDRQQEIKDKFLRVVDFGTHMNVDGFHVAPNNRFAMLVKVEKKKKDTPQAVWIYDQTSYERSPVYKVQESGVLGLHGNKLHVLIQLTTVGDCLEHLIEVFTATKEQE